MAHPSHRCAHAVHKFAGRQNMTKSSKQPEAARTEGWGISGRNQTGQGPQQGHKAQTYSLWPQNLWCHGLCKVHSSAWAGSASSSFVTSACLVHRWPSSRTTSIGQWTSGSSREALRLWWRAVQKLLASPSAQQGQGRTSRLGKSGCSLGLPSPRRLGRWSRYIAA